MVKMGNLPTHSKYSSTDLISRVEKKEFNLLVLHRYYILKSKTQTVLLAKHAAILSPSLFQQTSKMPPLPVYVLTILPSFNDHMCMDRSRDPLTKYSPLGLKATEYTGCL